MNIAVIFGGNSVEHEISIISALQAIENMPSKYNVIPVYLSKDMNMFSNDDFFNMETFKDELDLENNYSQFDFKKVNNEVYLEERKKGFLKKGKKHKIDIFFPIVHGTNVEDGKLQGFLSFFNLPIVGPSTLSGAISQDKAIAKELLNNKNVLQTKYLILNDNQKLTKHLETIQDYFDSAVIVKPANLGSSIGISIANTRDEIMTAIEEAFKYDRKIVVEELLEDFEEFNVSVVGNYLNYHISEIEKVFKTDNILSYEDKYLGNGKSKQMSRGMEEVQREIPANISQEMKDEINEIALKVAQTLECTGVVRIDLLFLNNKIYVNEINNIPGSLSFYLWEAAGKEYSKLLEEIIEISISDFFKTAQKETSFKTNVLSMNKQGVKK